MTETTALLRALHCDLAAVCGFLAALWYKTGESSGQPSWQTIPTLTKTTP